MRSPLEEASVGVCYLGGLLFSYKFHEKYLTKLIILMTILTLR